MHNIKMNTHTHTFIFVCICKKTCYKDRDRCNDVCRK